MREDKRQESNKDIHLDIPSEANREKHINFRDAEEKNNENKDDDTIDEFAKERRKEWEQGLSDGKDALEKSNQ